MNLRERVEAEKAKWNNSVLWAEVFGRIGYTSITLERNSHSNWGSIHQWCKEEIGTDHYTWTGSIFWFEYEKDATMFALKWA